MFQDFSSFSFVSMKTLRIFLCQQLSTSWAE